MLECKLVLSEWPRWQRPTSRSRLPTLLPRNDETREYENGRGGGGGGGLISDVEKFADYGSNYANPAITSRAEADIAARPEIPRC